MRWSFILLFALGACDDDTGVDDPCGEPSYGGDATDEAWKALVDAYDAASVGAVEAVTITTPGPGQVLAAATPATFAWTSPIAAGPIPGTILALAASAEDEGWFSAALGELGRFFIGTAHAHLPPITSDVYYLEVKVPGRACAVRAITTDETWTPSSADWAVLAGAGGPLELTITSAYLDENRISEGPYRPAAPMTFEVR